MSLNHQLKDRLREAEIDKPKKAEAPADTSKAYVAKAADADPLINNSTTSVGSTIAKIAADSPATPDMQDQTLGPDDLFTEEEIEITPAEKNEFLASLVSGSRYEQRFSVFNGRVSGRIRCRSTEESEAISTWTNIGIREGRYKAPLDYSLALRNALLAAQVMELNGTRFEPLSAPLYRTNDGDKTTEPGWLPAAASWSGQPEAVVAAVYNELKLFERKYWTMVSHATKQDFWRPVESTSR